MRFSKFFGDLAAGLTVSFAAISLGAAFGVMSGRGALAGMVGAAILPIIASVLGGTRIQASGPTAPMTAVSALIIAFAYDRFADRLLAEQFITLIFMMNAGLLFIAGLLRLGKLISFVPNVVVLGFMNGIAVLIWHDQILKLFGFRNHATPGGGVFLNVVVMAATLFVIFGIGWAVRFFRLHPRIRLLFPAVLLGIVVITISTHFTGLSVERISLGIHIDSLSEWGALLASYFPGREILTWPFVKMALPYALELAMLAYLDSLLTALVVDRLTRERTDQNRELIAQGVANAASGLLQGLPGAQATIRSVLLVREGANTRLAGICIGVFTFLSIGFFKDYLMLVPSAVFVAVLIKAGLDVCDKDFVRAYLYNRWFTSTQRNVQLGFIALTTAVTVFVDLNVAVIAGTMLFYIAKYLWKIEDVEEQPDRSTRQNKSLTTN